MNGLGDTIRYRKHRTWFRATFVWPQIYEVAEAVVGFLIGASLMHAVLSRTSWSQPIMDLTSLAAGIAITPVAFWFYEVTITLSIS